MPESSPKRVAPRRSSVTRAATACAPSCADSTPSKQQETASRQEAGDRCWGALFSVYKGAAFGGLDVPIVLILWQGYGVRATGFHHGWIDAGQVAHLHTQPVSEEAVINWAGSSEVYVDGALVLTGPPDVSLGPCGVFHGGRVPSDVTEPFLPGGFAAPPQLDPYLNTPFYRAEQFDEPPWSTREGAVAPPSPG